MSEDDAIFHPKMGVLDRIENWVFNNEQIWIEVTLDPTVCPQWLVRNFSIFFDDEYLDNHIDCEGVGSDLESAFDEFLANLQDKKKA